jgi:hypothetical protein
MEHGIPETDASSYSEGLKRGGTVVMVETPDADAQDVKDTLNACGAVDINRQSDMRTGATGLSNDAGAGRPIDIPVEVSDRRFTSSGASVDRESYNDQVGRSAIPASGSESASKPGTRKNVGNVGRSSGPNPNGKRQS